MFDYERQRDCDQKELASADEMPAWTKPSTTVLDVETGTLTTTGPVADGNGSTS
jgi:hypothetical protein